LPDFLDVPAQGGVAKPAAVLFDMDGTLVDSEKLWSIALHDYAEYRGGAVTAATREAMVGSNMRESMRMLLADLGLPAGATEIVDAATWVERRTAALFRQGLPWRPGAREALCAVRASGVPTALVTSTVRSLTEIALDTLGRRFFDVTVCGDEVNGRNKPEPEPYLRACRLLGVDPGECVAIEDSPTGVSSAVDAGCLVIAVPCEVPLQPGPRRILRASLDGLDMAVIAEYLAGPRE
jgi:HAD superfamily hydrolase (TIGR01509 family)